MKQIVDFPVNDRPPSYNRPLSDNRLPAGQQAPCLIDSLHSTNAVDCIFRKQRRRSKQRNAKRRFPY